MDRMVSQAIIAVPAGSAQQLGGSGEAEAPPHPGTEQSRRPTLDNDSDLKHAETKITRGQFLALTYVSVGIITGEIGTSPLYALGHVFSSPPTPDAILGVVSLIFWTMTLLCIVKYMGVVLLADDHGEGGTFALFAIICRSCNIHPVSGELIKDADPNLYDRFGTSSEGGGPPPPTAVDAPAPGIAGCLRRWVAATLVPGGAARPSATGAALKRVLRSSPAARNLLLGVVLMMTAMVLADGVLTPAISVLAAMEGLMLKTSLSREAVLGITAATLVVLFAVQRLGTGPVGVVFAPVVLLYFAANAGVAMYNLAMYEGGAMFRALSPHYAVQFFQIYGREGWAELGSVFLVVCGCEAMYADMGHFTPNAVRVAFGLLAYPVLVLVYLGQASWLMHHPEGYATVFYSSIPSPVYWPVFAVSVAASVVASQGLITSAFTIVVQSIALGCFPRVKVKHMSKDVGGQVYVPVVNLALMVLSIAVVLGFQTTGAIGYAYGITVNGVMVGTTLLVGLAMLVTWGCSVSLTLLFVVPFVFIEGAYLSANLMKVPDGGWFSVLVTVMLSNLTYLWWWGTSCKVDATKRAMERLDGLLTQTQQSTATTPPKPDTIPAVYGDGGAADCITLVEPAHLYRVPSQERVDRLQGMAVIYADASLKMVPSVFKRLLDHWGVHQLTVFATVRRVAVPFVPDAERLLLAPMELVGFYRCVMRYGYLDKVGQGPEIVHAMLARIRDLRSASSRTISTDAGPALGGRSPASLPEAPGRSLQLLRTSVPSAAGAVAGARTSAGDGAATGDVTAGAGAAGSIKPHSHPHGPSSEGTPNCADVVQLQSMGGEASRVVRVLQRPIFRPRADAGPLHSTLVRAYGGLWGLVQRGWEEWDIPGDSLFEVGLILEM